MSTLILSKPITVGTMVVCRQLTFRPVTAADMGMISLMTRIETAADVDKLIMVIAALTGVPSEIIDLIAAEDRLAMIETLSKHVAQFLPTDH